MIENDPLPPVTLYYIGDKEGTDGELSIEGLSQEDQKTLPEHLSTVLVHTENMRPHGS